jgi:hypothetical protein|tara:strand:+ start:398 stop:607 length:210 start_codon:yes stop_codon:yes gene_type:complete
VTSCGIDITNLNSRELKANLDCLLAEFEAQGRRNEALAIITSHFRKAGLPLSPVHGDNTSVDCTTSSIC